MYRPITLLEAGIFKNTIGEHKLGQLKKTGICVNVKLNQSFPKSGWETDFLVTDLPKLYNLYKNNTSLLTLQIGDLALMVT